MVTESDNLLFWRLFVRTMITFLSVFVILDEYHRLNEVVDLYLIAQSPIALWAVPTLSSRLGRKK